MSSQPVANGGVVAIFDLDGTLLPEPSLERRFFTALRRDHQLPSTNYLRWAIEACRQLPKGIAAIQHGNKRYLAGLARSLAFRYFDSFTFFVEGIDRIVWHAKRDHQIVLLSGTLEPLARLATVALEGELEARGIRIQSRVCATQLAEKNGYWSGYVIGDPLCGPAKAHAIEKLARNAHFDLRESHAYVNSLADRHVLFSLGHAHAVNPGRALAVLANERDWPIWHWHIEKTISAQRERSTAPEIARVEEQV